MSSITRIAVPLAAVALFAAGCGGSDEKDTSGTTAGTTTAATPTVAKATGGAITVKMSDFKFTPQDISAPAGKLTITAPNDGNVAHELVLVKSDKPAGSFPVKNGRVSEDGSVGEISETPAGKTKSHTFDLQPGKYVMICNISGHYQAGMYGSIVVQ